MVSYFLDAVASRVLELPQKITPTGKLERAFCLETRPYNQARGKSSNGEVFSKRRTPSK